MMNLGDLEDAMINAREAIEAQTAGLMQLCGGISVQTEMLKQQLKLMNEIRDLLTADQGNESPLVGVLRRMTEAIESQGAALTRIETAIGKR